MEIIGSLVVIVGVTLIFFQICIGVNECINAFRNRKSSKKMLKEDKLTLTKNCEVCGTKISKLQSIWNIYLLKTGVSIKCPNCNSEYKTYKVISFFGDFYTGGASFLVFIIVLPTFWSFFENIFNSKLGIEVLVYTFVALSLVEFVIMLIIPLKKIDNTKEH